MSQRVPSSNPTGDGTTYEATMYETEDFNLVVVLAPTVDVIANHFNKMQESCCVCVEPYCTLYEIITNISNLVALAWST